MTINQFNRLNFTEQTCAVWDSGNFIEVRSVDSTDYVLFQLEDFFVEIEYDSRTDNILSLKPFKTVRLLEPYLQSVDLSEIIRLL
jgi:hypothetical protein